MSDNSIVSFETLIYVGLSIAKAEELWNRWTHWERGEYDPRRETDPDDGGLTVMFDDFIVGWSVTNRVDAIGTDDDLKWRECLNASGIDTATQDAIMDPNFTHLRRSKSCLYWAKETIEMRYRGLSEAQHSTYNPQQPSTSETKFGNCASLNTPGHTTLFKAVDRARITNLLDQSGKLSRPETLLSTAPLDFSGSRSLYYFTPDHNLARRQAAYAKRRAPRKFIVIISFLIPNTAIENLSPLDLQRVSWPSNDWKELLWHSRNQKLLPPHLRKYRDATLVIGTMAYGADAVYQGMKTWEEVGEECVFWEGKKGQGGEVVQYVFSGEEGGHDFLTEHAQDVKVIPYTAAAPEEFLANPTWWEVDISHASLLRKLGLLD
ncbi:hypothetical protein VF21_06964 [Pseudogymnoascus sp. 05NY08]|nr:hypothetical protein VF21_06964 [Pseudogymnoascus sp. 05NY08]